MATEITASVDPLGSRVVARTLDGHLVAMDPDPPDGGGSAAGPKETLLASLAACTAVDVAAILRKKRQPAATYEVAVHGVSAEEHPRVFTRIMVEHRVAGAVTPEALRRSIELSATRYCPVNAMLAGGDVEIEHRYRLEPAEGEMVEAVVAIVGPRGRVRVVG
ncbi:MAG TPA: OsmC family protein [Candidatus Limnocylindria bacterium]|nr:OsmC family protein [Candidatus Limnocylindria bacterium]